MTEDAPDYKLTQEDAIPLEENPVIKVSFRNINVSGKSSKDGMIYKLNAEIVEEDFDRLRSMPLVGMSAEAILEITNINEGLFSDAETEQREAEHKDQAQAKDEDPYHDKKIGSLCKEITQDYCPAPLFQDFCADIVWADNSKSSAHFAGEAVKRWIGFKSRKSVDYDEKAKKAWLNMVHVYRSWLEDRDKRTATAGG